MSLDKKLKNAYIFVLHNFLMSSGNKCMIISCMGNSVLYEKLKISSF